MLSLNKEEQEKNNPLLIYACNKFYEKKKRQILLSVSEDGRSMSLQNSKIYGISIRFTIKFN